MPMLQRVSGAQEATAYPACWSVAPASVSMHQTGVVESVCLAARTLGLPACLASPALRFRV